MKIVILGNGISGVTAARYLRKQSDHDITIVSGETTHFFSRTALMYIYMGHMKFEHTKPYEDWFWKKNRINLHEDWIKKIDFEKKELIGTKGNVSYDKLILAMGSESNKFGWPGQDLDGVHGLYTIQDLDAMERHSKDLKRAIIVGGGLIGIEMAEMFHSRHIPVTMLVREKSYWDAVLPQEESQMINKHILANGIDLRLETELKEIVDNGNGKCNAVITSKGDKIPCGFVGLTAGVHPNTSMLKDTGLKLGRGIVVNKYLETNISDVYAIGDCAEQESPLPGRRPVEAIWYTGRMMGETVAYNICGKAVPYDPGIWFNSAKFFDIEYQVYGTLLAKPPKNHKAIYWEHEDRTKSVRVVFNEETNEILGFNLMGIRFRHEVCEKWLREKTNIELVLKDLELANFDPEFYKTFESEIISIYNKTYNKNLKLNRAKGLNKVLAFLKS